MASSELIVEGKNIQLGSSYKQKWGHVLGQHLQPGHVQRGGGHIPSGHWKSPAKVIKQLG